MTLTQFCSWSTGTLLVCYLAGCASAQQQSPIKVSSAFDGGSIDTLTESPANFLSGKTLHWKQQSGSDDQYYWFYFKLGNVQDKTVTIQLTNLVGVYRGKPHLIYTGRTRPVYSYDNIHWQRIDSAAYDPNLHTLTFRNTFTGDSVWIAYAHPYTYSRELSFLHSLPAENPYLSVKKLGTSAQSRAIHLLTITDTSIPAKDKKVALITTLQHAGEYPGGFFVEGLVNFLLSSDTQAAEARKTLIFKIIPMMNPDGIFHGMTRLNGNHEDLNQEWDDDFTDTAHAPTEPEVACVKQWIREWIKNGNTIDLGLDVHSQGQEGTANYLHTPADILGNFTKSLNKFWPVEYVPMDFPGSANHCLVSEFNIPSGTFEIPQSNVNGGKYLTIEDYQAYGKGTAQAIYDYFVSGSQRH